jgi:hypothetical protein
LTFVIYVPPHSDEVARPVKSSEGSNVPCTNENPAKPIPLPKKIQAEDCIDLTSPSPPPVEKKRAKLDNKYRLEVYHDADRSKKKPVTLAITESQLSR